MKNYNKKVIGGKTYDRWGEISGKNSDLNTEDAVAAFEKKGYSVKTYRIPDGKGTYEIWIRKKTPAKSR